MRIATWNINSVRLRLDHVKKLASEFAVDVLCLQETKVKDEEFPLNQVKMLGFNHVEICGEKGYNGVAVLSKLPLTGTFKLKLVREEDCRHLAVVLPSGIELHNFYVPAGGDEPDPQINPSFAHKLQFLEHMAEWFTSNRTKSDKLIMVGDLNVAPLPHDVWSHKQLLKVVSHTPDEVTRMERLEQTLSWCDVSRHFVPAEQKLYSWWSYRNRDWRKSDRGRRLDHIWVTPPLKASLVNSYIIKDARDWSSPSDHVPVVVDL